MATTMTVAKLEVPTRRTGPMTVFKGYALDVPPLLPFSGIFELTPHISSLRRTSRTSKAGTVELCCEPYLVALSLILE
ncbi:hypothetical protein SCLCIDRAFT_1027040 [Scleroderma citrinum Foug A]|uniref:Uncharacterized protein n=1 Tax=Scleroderma citrinum Foug A TaxID=1036808 RepID=A0A0C3DSU7_9AGAM|nr:hypothetical protein SCLCIDRAFT_1027040 [Scleroderma citrinum Foug A]